MSWWGWGRNLPQTRRTMPRYDLAVSSGDEFLIISTSNTPCRLNYCFYKVDILSCGRNGLLCFYLSVCVQITFRRWDLQGYLCWGISQKTHEDGKERPFPQITFLPSVFSVFTIKYQLSPFCLKTGSSNHFHLYQFHNYGLPFFIRNLSQNRSICRFPYRNSYKGFYIWGRRGLCFYFFSIIDIHLQKAWKSHEEPWIWGS